MRDLLLVGAAPDRARAGGRGGLRAAACAGGAVLSELLVPPPHAAAATSAADIVPARSRNQRFRYVHAPSLSEGLPSPPPHFVRDWVRADQRGSSRQHLLVMAVVRFGKLQRWYQRCQYPVNSVRRLFWPGRLWQPSHLTAPRIRCRHCDFMAPCAHLYTDRWLGGLPRRHPNSVRRHTDSLARRSHDRRLSYRRHCRSRDAAPNASELSLVDDCRPRRPRSAP